MENEWWKRFFSVSRVDICIYSLCRFYKVYSTFDILFPDQDFLFCLHLWFVYMFSDQVLDNKWMSTSLIDPN